MKLLVGVTGSIAAYKSLDLVRQLKRQNAEVKFILTTAAQHFVTPLSCQILSGNDVYTEQFTLTRRVEHVHFNDWADMMVIAPATADIIGKIAAGIADDLLTTTVCSFSKPLLIVPAMDSNMWGNRIVQENVLKLKRHGYHFLEPSSGALASGKIGKGRFPDNYLIIRKIMSIKHGYRAMPGRRILISGGHTEENIDPVRVITNRSSGMMGTELMTAAYCREAEVYGIFGEAKIIPMEMPVERVRSSAEMFNSIKSKYGWCECLIMAAAVGDYQPSSKSAKKIHRSALALKMKKTVDILSSLRKDKSKFIVGFSLEDDDSMIRAKNKIKDKHLDMIVMNGAQAIGSEKISARIMFRNRKMMNCGQVTKWELANIILDQVITGMDSKRIK